jgi:NAD(P)-dependent dehydrogenase (short-subunit alcohol dehydrogenase family)
MKTIRGKAALVTGAASGIGRAIALALAREGADVYLLDIDTANLSRVVAEAEQYGTRVMGRRCDLTRPEQTSATVHAILKDWGRLDILVNNAGISYRGKTEQMDREQWDQVLGLNLLAPVQLTRELLPTLLARDEAHIVNVCSIMGLAAIPHFAAYQTSKFGLVGFSESLRAEYAYRGLGVTALCPGSVRTNIFRATNGKPKVPEWMRASPEQVAARTIKAIYRNQGIVPVTRLAQFIWFVKRFSPRLWDFAIRARRRRPWRSRDAVGAECPPHAVPADCGTAAKAS